MLEMKINLSGDVKEKLQNLLNGLTVNRVTDWLQFFDFYIGGLSVIILGKLRIDYSSLISILINIWAIQTLQLRIDYSSLISILHKLHQKRH